MVIKNSGLQLWLSGTYCLRNMTCTAVQIAWSCTAITAQKSGSAGDTITSWLKESAVRLVALSFMAVVLETSYARKSLLHSKRGEACPAIQR